jgi:hypothetical protein
MNSLLAVLTFALVLLLATTAAAWEFTTSPSTERACCLDALDHALADQLSKGPVPHGDSPEAITLLANLLNRMPKTELSPYCKKVVAQFEPHWATWEGTGCWTDQRNVPEHCCAESPEDITTLCALVAIARRQTMLREPLGIDSGLLLMDTAQWLHRVDCAARDPVQHCLDVYAGVPGNARFYELCCSADRTKHSQELAKICQPLSYFKYLTRAACVDPSLTDDDRATDAWYDSCCTNRLEEQPESAQDLALAEAFSPPNLYSGIARTRLNRMCQTAKLQINFEPHK